MVRRWLSIGYFLIHLLPPDRSLPAFVDIGDSFRNDGDCALMAMPVGTTRVAIDQYDCSFVSHVLCRQSASLCRPVCERRGWWEAVVLPVLTGTGGAYGRHQPKKKWRFRP